ncbi:hypothetical protein EFB14_19295 [Rhizobium fabae]|nr:hypothetical protein EFB14_19295 [Rhizobium fabae]
MHAMAEKYQQSIDAAVLPLDVMPDRIELALALLKANPPKGEQRLYEVKWDGYRLAIHKSGDDVRLITRGGHDWKHRFPTIVAAAATLRLEPRV